MSKVQRYLQRARRSRELVVRHASSGLSVRAFCRQEQLNESSFYAWQRTLAEPDRETSADDNVAQRTPLFVPAVVTSDAGPPQSASEATVTLELPGGCTLRLSGQTAIEQLADLVIALQERGV